MATLQLKVQYFQDSTPEEVPCREENFVVRELDFALPVEQTALVLIDLWNVHHIDSWIERAEAVTKEVIAPLIGQARKCGLTIVQAPSPGVLDNFPDKYEVYQGYTPEPEPGPVPNWPPVEFRQPARGVRLFPGAARPRAGHWSLLGEPNRATRSFAPYRRGARGLCRGHGPATARFVPRARHSAFAFCWLCDQLVYIGSRLRGSRYAREGI